MLKFGILFPGWELFFLLYELLEFCCPPDPLLDGGYGFVADEAILEDLLLEALGTTIWLNVPVF